MKFYQIENQVDTDEVGRNIYPQTDGLVGNATFSSNTSYSLLSYHNMPEEFIPLETIKLANSAKQSDFISTAIISGYGFIVSDRVKNIILEHIIVNHKFFKIPIIHRQNELNNYNWLHLFQPKQEYIDFKKSTFQVKRFSNIIKEEIQFKSIEDYWDQRKYYKPGELFKAKEIYINTNNFDFLYTGVGGIKYIVSEKLLNSLKENEITGYKILNLENIVFENQR